MHMCEDALLLLINVPPAQVIYLISLTHTQSLDIAEQLPHRFVVHAVRHILPVSGFGVVVNLHLELHSLVRSDMDLIADAVDPIPCLLGKREGATC